MCAIQVDHSLPEAFKKSEESDRRGKKRQREGRAEAGDKGNRIDKMVSTGSSILRCYILSLMSFPDMVTLEAAFLSFIPT